MPVYSALIRKFIPQGISGIILDSPEHAIQLLVVARDGFIGQSRRPPVVS